MKERDSMKTKEQMLEEKEKKQEVILALKYLNVKDMQCGLGSCTPRWFQVFANKEAYLAVYCIVGLVIGMFFTYSVSIVSTIEKRFKLNSKQTGIILAGNDVSQILLSIFVAYFGNYGNRPKWLGAGVISASFSCLLAALPHFIYGPGNDAINVATQMEFIAANTSGVSPITDLKLGSTEYINRNKNDFCYDPYVGDCSEGGSDLHTFYLGPIILLFLSQFFVGIAVTVFYSLGLVYLDDNVNKKDSALYYALSMIVRVAGPVLGFFLGSKCLSLYIIPNYKPNISLRDPRWLGAWWLGYLFLAVLLAICGTLIVFFPRVLPSTVYKQIRRIHKEKGIAEPLSRNSDLTYLLELAKTNKRFTKPSIKKLPAALKRLATNKIWVGTNFNTVLVLFAMMGYWNFKPKFLEYQFRKSASAANFYTGVASLVASVLGLTISGVVIKILRPRPRIITGYSCFLTVFSSITMLSLMFIGCSKLDIIGPNYEGEGFENCYSNCGCTDRYSPVCSEDGLTTFYSPCYAGCTVINDSAVPVEYYNCNCVPPSPVMHYENISHGLVSTVGNPKGGKAIQGYCPETCDTFFYYIVVTIITKVIDSTGRIGGTLVYLRSVEEQDKGLALGMSTMLISLFAFIPAPIVMGAIVDSSCIIWDNTCGQIGNCWLYDSDKFRILIHAVPAAIILVSLLGDILVFMHSKDLILYGEDEEDEKGTAKEKDKIELGRENGELKLKITKNESINPENNSQKT